MVPSLRSMMSPLGTPMFASVQGLAEVSLIESKLFRCDVQSSDDEDNSPFYFSSKSLLSRQDLAHWFPPDKAATKAQVALALATGDAFDLVAQVEKDITASSKQELFHREK
ncbi:hypothetical protein VNO77_14940 [Canavalia gladiata]|uniref:Uncharacterized protein n=1 Tax=Canavalia gladiata TaxID=3824 RepID=A0AAN9LYJ1_CANGL